MLFARPDRRDLVADFGGGAITSDAGALLLGATEEIARIVARIRARWPKVRILLRGDSGFAREALMAWCP